MRNLCLLLPIVLSLSGAWGLDSLPMAMAAGHTSTITATPAVADDILPPSVFLHDEPPGTLQQKPDLQPNQATTPDSISWGWQFGRTIMALLLVLVLIYFSLRIALPRMLQGLPGKAGKQLHLVERLPLDARHAVVLLEVADGMRLLLGTGDGGVQLLTVLPLGHTVNFRETLEEAQQEFDNQQGVRRVKSN